jgi:hypothetical protein
VVFSGRRDRIQHRGEGRANLVLLMIVLAVSGIVLLTTAPFLARLLTGRGRDRTGLTRIIQVLGAALLVAALFARPYNPTTTAVPGPPGSPGARPR